MRRAIDGEIKQRYRLFRSVGARDANEYEEIRLAGPRSAARADPAGHHRRVPGAVRQPPRVDRPGDPHRSGGPRLPTSSSRWAGSAWTCRRCRKPSATSPFGWRCAPRSGEDSPRRDRFGRRIASAVEGERLRAAQGGAAGPGAVPLLLRVGAVRGAQDDGGGHDGRHELHQAAATTTGSTSRWTRRTPRRWRPPQPSTRSPTNSSTTKTVSRRRRSSTSSASRCTFRTGRRAAPVAAAAGGSVSPSTHWSQAGAASRGRSTTAGIRGWCSRWASMDIPEEIPAGRARHRRGCAATSWWSGPSSAARRPL